MKKIVALGVVVFTLVGLYGAAWFWAAGQASAIVRDLGAGDGYAQPRITCGDFAVSGFPFGFDLTCTNASVESNDVTISFERLQAAVAVYRPTHVLLFANSPAHITDSFTGSRSRVDFTSAQASVRLDGWRIGRVSLVVDSPAWVDTVFEDRPVAEAARIEAHLLDIPERHVAETGIASLAHYTEVTGLKAPAFGISEGRVTLESEITNLPDDVRTYGDAGLLQRWQAAGGRLILNSWRGDDPAGKFDITGTLGLDSAGRPEGQLKLSSTGVVEEIEPLLPPDYRAWIVGQPAADGSYSQTLNIAAGVVMSGLVPLGMLPPLY